MSPVSITQPVIAAESEGSSVVLTPGSAPCSKLPFTTNPSEGGGGGGGGGSLFGTMLTLSRAAPPKPSVRLTNVNCIAEADAVKSSVLIVQCRSLTVEPVA